MRIVALILSMFAAPAVAWEFTSLPLCTLSHATDQADIALTYDPGVPLYTLAITRRNGSWPAGGTFSMAFANTRPAIIRTDRQSLSDNNTTLTVADNGFGNVLNGLEFGGTIRAAVADDFVDMTSDGITAPMAAFKTCETAALS